MAGEGELSIDLRIPRGEMWNDGERRGGLGRISRAGEKAMEKDEGYYFCSLSVNWNHKIPDRF